MKNIKKTIIGVAVLAALSMSAFGLTACGNKKSSGSGDDGALTGEYQYTNYGTNYGVKVKVYVNDDGNTIKKVEIANSNYVEVSPANETYGWTQDSVDAYNNNKSTLLAAYSGKSILDIQNYTVACADSGEPLAQNADGFKTYDSSLLMTGATQCSGRLLLAVQNAVKDYKASYVGEYQYSNYGTNYGVKVKVTVNSDKTINKVEILDSDYVEVSPANETYGWTQESVNAYLNNKATLLGKYAGKSVSDIKAISVACAESGEPLAQSAEGFTSYDSDLLMTGATQCSGRLLKAVQNALASIS